MKEYKKDIEFISSKLTELNKVFHYHDFLEKPMDIDAYIILSKYLDSKNERNEFEDKLYTSLVHKIVNSMSEVEGFNYHKQVENDIVYIGVEYNYNVICYINPFNKELYLQENEDILVAKNRKKEIWAELEEIEGSLETLEANKGNAAYYTDDKIQIMKLLVDKKKLQSLYAETQSELLEEREELRDEFIRIEEFEGENKAKFEELEVCKEFFSKHMEREFGFKSIEIC